MKKMKKVVSAMLAASMVMSMGITTFADSYVVGEDGNYQEITNPKDGKYTDTEYISITKNYFVTNEGSVSPAENLEFEVEFAGVEDAGVDPETGAVVTTAELLEVVEARETVADNDESVVGIVLNEGNATMEGTENKLYLKLPQYKAVGVYSYTVTEEANDLAGVTYFTTPITVVVTVIQDGTNQLRVAAVHAEVATEEDSKPLKTDEFKNTYSAGTLEVSKTVSGLLGDQSKEFSITVTFTSDKEVNAPIYDSAITEDTDKTKVNVLIPANEWSEKTENGATYYTASETFTLTHGTALKFYNIPAGVEYSVNEASYYTSDGYTVSYTSNDIENSVDDATVTYENNSAEIDYVTGTISQNENSLVADDDSVSITNTKDGVIDTGISLDSMPYIMVLAMAFLGMFGFVSKKRNMEF